MKIDLTKEMIVWHACPVAVLEDIKREGLRVMRESIYVGIHPGIPIAFGRKHYDGYALFALRLTHADWTWGAHNGYEMMIHEGMLRQDVSKDDIVEMLSEDEIAERLRDNNGRTGRLFGTSTVVSGYAGWLNEPYLIASCREVFASRPSFRYALAGLYVTRLGDDCDASAVITETVDAMLRLLDADCELPTGAVRVALSVLERCDLDALAEHVADIRVDVPPERLYLVYLKLDAEHKSQLIDVLRLKRPAIADGLLAMTRILSGDDNRVLSTHHADLLARCVVFGMTSNADARRIISALADVPGDISNDALLYLLRYIRQVPSRSRQLVVTALRARKGALLGQLEEIARFYNGFPRRSVNRILGQEPTLNLHRS